MAGPVIGPAVKCVPQSQWSDVEMITLDTCYIVNLIEDPLLKSSAKEI